jgi:hypothetical protein
MRKKDHKTKPGVMEIPRSTCDQPGCEFRGKPVAQGVCYNVLDKKITNYCDDVMRRADEQLKGMRAMRAESKETPAKWIKTLESYLTCAWTNEEFMLDSLIHLRVENAKLKLALGKYGKKE